MRRKVGVLFVLLAMLGFTQAFSAVPEPIVSIDFNGNWNSGGSGGADSGMVVEVNGVSPKFGSGILSDCFDQNDGEFDQPGGAVVFGDTISQTPIQTALSGLASFTISGLVKMPASVYGASGHHGTVLFSALDVNGDHAIAVLLDPWNRLSLVVNNQVEVDPYGDTGIHWFSNFTDENWFFFSLSYDGTVDPSSDPFDVQNVVCYSGPFSGSIAYRPVISTSYDGIIFEGNVNDVVDLVWVGNAADTATRWVYDDVETAHVVDYDPSQAFPATFAGQLEAIKIFGSKTDASGVLTAEQVTAVKENILLSVLGENPRPVGDINRDFVVDMADFAEMAETWLTDARP